MLLVIAPISIITKQHRFSTALPVVCHGNVIQAPQNAPYLSKRFYELFFFWTCRRS